MIKSPRCWTGFNVWNEHRIVIGKSLNEQSQAFKMIVQFIACNQDSYEVVSERRELVPVWRNVIYYFYNIAIKNSTFDACIARRK